MKTVKIYIKIKDEATPDFSCGMCFNNVEPEDSYCWGCGAEFDDGDNIAYSYEELKEYNDKNNLDEQQSQKGEEKE